MHARNAAQSGSRRVSAVSPTMHHSSVDGSRLCEKRVIDVRRLHFCVRYAEKQKNRAISRESYTLLIPRGKTWVKWREHNNDALITHIAASLFSTAHRQRNLARVPYINAITITKLYVPRETIAYRSHCDELLRLAPTKIHFTRDITNIRNVPRNF